MRDVIENTQIFIDIVVQRNRRLILLEGGLVSSPYCHILWIKWQSSAFTSNNIISVTLVNMWLCGKTCDCYNLKPLTNANVASLFIYFAFRNNIYVLVIGV